VQCQVGAAEQAGETGESVRGVLHVCLEEEVERAFERDEPVGVTVGFGGVADDEARASS
jgi:hypothetical protein